jgi:hypothetical protein
LNDQQKGGCDIAHFTSSLILIACTASPQALTTALEPNTKTQAQSANSFVDSISVNTHVNYTETDYGIAEELMRQGIPRERIVLGFQPPKWRVGTGFATGE